MSAWVASSSPGGSARDARKYTMAAATSPARIPAGSSVGSGTSAPSGAPKTSR